MKTKDIFSEDMDLKPHTYNERPDHEVQMARSDLYKAGKYAIELHNMLKRVGEQQGLEGWVQAKITKAADYLESVYHYLDYEMKNPSSNLEMEAAPVTPGSTPPGQTVTPANSSSRSSAVVPGTKIAQPTPGMVTMSKVDSSGRTQGMPVKVPQSQIMMKQQQGLKVIGDSKINKKKPVGETISAGSVAAVAGANGMGMGKKEIGSLFGGTFKQDEAANAINMKKAGKKPKHKEEEMEEGVDIRNRPVPQIQTAIARSRKIPNSKVIKLGPNRGYVVVDRSDPRPEVKPDLTVIGDVSKADQRYRQILKQMRRLEKEYDTLSPGKPELRTANVQNMLKNTNYRELRKEKQKMMDIIKQHKDQPRHIADRGMAEGGDTGPKFTGYYKGTDKGKPGKKMVGDA